jgi:hypothetical protein
VSVLIGTADTHTTTTRDHETLDKPKMKAKKTEVATGLARPDSPPGAANPEDLPWADRVKTLTD